MSMSIIISIVISVIVIIFIIASIVKEETHSVKENHPHGNSNTKKE